MIVPTRRSQRPQRPQPLGPLRATASLCELAPGLSIKWWYHNSWMVFVMENPMNMDDLGVPPFQETFGFLNFQVLASAAMARGWQEKLSGNSKSHNTAMEQHQRAAVHSSSISSSHGLEKDGPLSGHIRRVISASP